MRAQPCSIRREAEGKLNESTRQMQSSHQSSEIAWQGRIDRNRLRRAWMDELQALRVKRNAIDAVLFGFRGMILAVADDGMADGGELDADLVLQSGDELDVEQRRVAELALEPVMEFGASGLGVAGRT